MTVAIQLIKGREKSLLRRHPWIFSRAIASIEGDPGLGETVDVLDFRGRWLARAAYSPHSQIRARVWTFDPEEQIDAGFFRRRLQRALAIRQEYIERNRLSGYRLVAAESDGLPGITIDRYDNYLVCQLLSAGAETHRDTLAAQLRELLPECHLFERSDVAVRRKEGLKPLSGPIYGPEPSAPVVINENQDVKILVDIREGHKTGFYLDQRENRQIAAHYVAGKEVLNCFCYTGGFGVYALKGGATSVVNVDVSATALEYARQNAELNQLDLGRAQFIKEDVFQLLRSYRDQGRRFDVIVLDPPKFIDSKAQLERGCRGYKDINMLAMQLLRPGGTLLTFSCSGLMPAELFQKVVADAALDAGREALFVERLSQAPDHPIGSAYPEGFYLKGLVVRVH